MSETEVIVLAKIHYYCREKYYRSMQLAAVEGLKRYVGDTAYRFHYGVSLILEGRVQEGIRELYTIQDHRDVALGCLLALIYAHRKCKIIDREAVDQLESKLREVKKHIAEKTLYYGGLFQVFIGQPERSKDYIDKMLRVAPYSKEGSVLRGWIELMTTKDVLSKDTLKYFDSSNNSDPEAVFGRAKYFENLGNFSRALEILNQAVVLFPNYTPALVEKMKMQLALQDWEQTLDSCQRALNQDKNCLEAYRFLILHSLCKESDFSQVAHKLTELIQMLENLEPKNAVLYIETAQLFSRLCGRSSSVLQCTYSLVEKATALESSDVTYVTELGYQCLLQGNIKEAMKYYRNATKLDESSVDALIGMIFCQILDGQLDIADQQLELLKEIHRSTGMTPEMLFLCGLSSHKQSKGPEEVMSYLSECVDKHFFLLEGLSYGIKYYRLLNPDFLLLVVKLFMNFIPDQPVTSGQPMPPALKKSISILQSVTRACPGLMEASFLMAKLKYLSGDMTAAQTMLHHCLENDAAFSDARLLLAQIMLHEGNHQTASQALEIALSYSFDVREKPQFHLIKAKIQKQQGLLTDAVKTLQTGMSLAGLKPSSAGGKRARQDTSTNDKVSLYLELAEAYRCLNQQHEAMKVMQDATNAFQGTAEEVRITVANADLALARGSVDEALSILRSVGPEQPYYLQAREKMANIYLHQRKDRRLFASCYREVVEKFPTTQSFLLLGDAYMNIQEPERAIEVYEQALKKNPRDSVLARKIGQALVKTHHYDKAVTYYKAAIKTGGQVILRYDLAELLFRMKRYKEADDVIASALESEKLANDITWLQWEAKFLLLLSQVYAKVQYEDKAVSTLQRAWDVQTRVMRRIHLEQPDSLPEQRQIAINICRQLAEHASAKKDYSPAIQFYKEALTFDDNNAEILLALAKLEMAANNLDAARQYCTAVLKGDTENDAATLMMADLMFRKTDLESAMFHFQQLLDRKPDYFRALARFIEAVRRLGKLEEVPHYLQKAEHYSSRTSLEAGFNYCKGLYEWYTGNTSGAMKCFNKARHDPEWGQIATYHMIEICVNPDNETFGGEGFSEGDEISHERTDSQESAVRTAEKLLNELKSKVGPDLDVRIMNNFVLIAKHNKADAEDALNDFLQIVSDERHKDHVGVILGMSTAHVILKQTPRARNQLKRVAKNAWNFGDAEYLERAWLLLADIYIKAGKLEMASDLLKRVLQHNKSCTKAYDLMGYIMEKEQNYRDAAYYYELAWKQTNKTSPIIGYKLSFNYMKAKRYVDAIDVCHAVLNKFPNYPKIRKEILDKSRSNLRV